VNLANCEFDRVPERTGLFFIGGFFMVRRFLPLLIVLCVCVFHVRQAKAEYAYEYGVGNWCGWDFYPTYWGEGGTVQGSILRGMGYYLEGAGEYNLLSAQAGAINSQTWITLNEYLYKSELEAARRYQALNAQRKDKAKAGAQKHYLQLRDFPTTQDIHQGNAINLKVALLTDPAYAETVYKALSVDLTPEFIDRLPLYKGAYGTTVTLAELRNGIKYPRSLAGEVYAEHRTTIDRARATLSEKNFQNVSSPDLTNEFRAATENLKAELKKNHELTGENYEWVSRMDRLSKALASGGLGENLSPIASLTPRTLGGLLREMKNQGLRFGSAENAAEVAATDKLFAVLKAAPTLLDKDTLKALADEMANYRY
jgi:hypothetical protein